MKNLCVIDMGTNTFNMLVADPTGKTVYNEKVAVKLGKGGINQGHITPEAFERAINTMSYFKRKAYEFNSESINAIATSAVRNASNGQDLVNSIAEHTGIEVQVISGIKEAEYIFKGVQAAMDLGVCTSLVIDIGGGSVEFIIGTNTSLIWSQSFEIGAQRLYDKFHLEDPISVPNTQSLIDFLDESLHPLILACQKYEPTVLIGSSGTFDTLAEIDILEKALNIDYNSTSEYNLAFKDYQRISTDIIKKSRSLRMEIPGMIEMRADMIVVACILINFVLERTGINQIRVSSYSLKEGVLNSIKLT